ncbi:unknown [Firmicutes bacterium CAG:822]|nr:unknown [Firmicutes bacterium CAG:822]
MFKKIKENPYYQKFKEMRADPKLRPITSLILWFIFFVIVILFARGLTSTRANLESTETQKTTLSDSNYEFTYSNNSGVIFGQTYDDKLEFMYGGNRYYYNGETVYLIQSQQATIMPAFDLNVLKINSKMINNLISNLNYNMDGEAKQYLVPLSNFLNLYEVDVEADLSLANQYNIVINVYENDNGIYMYKLDLTNYYNYRGLNNDGILTIDIYNSEVNDFTKYYDELVGGVK